MYSNQTLIINGTLTPDAEPVLHMHAPSLDGAVLYSRPCTSKLDNTLDMGCSPCLLDPRQHISQPHKCPRASHDWNPVRTRHAADKQTFKTQCESILQQPENPWVHLPTEAALALDTGCIRMSDAVQKHSMLYGCTQTHTQHWHRIHEAYACLTLYRNTA